MHSVWKTSIRFTLIATVLLGLGYPLVVTAIAGLLFPHKASGSLILKDGQVIGSELLAQSFTSDRYFHPRPSAAGTGYDASASGGSNLSQSSKTLIDRIQGSIDKLAKENPGKPVPIDLVTASASGLCAGLGGLELGQIDGGRRQRRLHRIDDLPHAKEKRHRQDRQIDASGNADGPGIAPDRHPVGHGDRRRGQFQRRQLGRKEDVAEALVKPGPDGGFLDGNAKCEVESAAVRDGRGSRGLRFWLDEQVVCHV